LPICHKRHIRGEQRKKDISAFMAKEKIALKSEGDQEGRQERDRIKCR